MGRYRRIEMEKNAVKVKKPSNDAILKQFEETEKLFNKVMNKGK